jgi:putative transposase
VAPNALEHDFTAKKPDKKYVGHITYIWTLEGWMYLAVAIDLYSRRIVGWSMDKNMRALLVYDALLMALLSRDPRKA